MKAGFTLIEMLLYIAIVAGLATASVIFVTDVTAGRIKASVQERVVYSARYVTERVGREIRGASAVGALSASELCLTMVEPARNPTRIYLSGGVVKIGWGGSCASPTVTYDLTGPEVSVTGLTFTNLSSGSSKNVKYSLTIEGATNSVRQEWIFSTTVEGADELRTN